MAKKQRAWFIDKLKRIGIVEKTTNVATKDGYTSDWGSISEVKDVRIYAISLDDDINITTASTGDTLTAEAYLQIPTNFHEVLVYKAIAMGYKDPRNFDIEKAQYFDMEYNLGLKEAKKFARSNYQTTGRAAPQEY
jgi:hypothetical protein